MLSKQQLSFGAPAGQLRDALSAAGFVRDFSEGSSTYRAELESPKGSVYVYQLPYREQDGSIVVHGEASFFDGLADTDVPDTIREAALLRLGSVRNRLGTNGSHSYSPDRGDRRLSTPMPPKPVDEAKNGSMVQDFEDMKRLGKDMERVQTGQQLKEEGLVSDPIQH